MGFQIIFSILLVVAIFRLVDQFRKGRITIFFFLFFLFAWCAALIFNWNNRLLNTIGHLLGIERGATVLVYVALLFLFYYFFIGVVKFYKMEQDINKIVKKEAIEDFLRRHDPDKK